MTAEAFLDELVDFLDTGGTLPDEMNDLFALFGEPEGYWDILVRLVVLLSKDRPSDGAEAIRVLVSVLTRDPALRIGDALRARLDFGVSGSRRYRQARKLAAELLAEAANA